MKAKALGGLLSLSALMSLVTGTPAHAGGNVPPGGTTCQTTLLANVGIHVGSGTAVWITDKNGVLLKESLVLGAVVDARLEVCVSVDVNAFVDIGAAIPVDKDGDKKADYVLVKVGVLSDVDGHAQINAKIKARLAVHLSLNAVASVDANVDLKKGEKYECDTGGGKK